MKQRCLAILLVLLSLLAIFYFRYVDTLAIGDEVSITNLWETLTYAVAESRIIYPDESEAVHIQEGRDLVTLLTCHPYASGGKQRLLVFCERVLE